VKILLLASIVLGALLSSGCVSSVDGLVVRHKMQVMSTEDIVLRTDNNLITNPATK